MNWRADFQSTFLQTLANYPSTVTLMLAGHTHMDEYRILPSGNVLEQLPGISPCFGNNPAYKILTITRDTFTPTDYESFDYDLTSTKGQFFSLYKFSDTYPAPAASTLNYSLQQLYLQLSNGDSPRGIYSYYYASGTTGENPITKTKWNPINGANWPIFSCTIGNVAEPDYIDCVDTY